MPVSLSTLLMANQIRIVTQDDKWSIAEALPVCLAFLD